MTKIYCPATLCIQNECGLCKAKNIELTFKNGKEPDELNTDCKNFRFDIVALRRKVAHDKCNR